MVLSVRVEAGGAALADARVRAGAASTVTNAVGLARLSVAAGSVMLRVTRLGYSPDSVALVLRAGNDTLVTLVLTDLAARMTTVVVTSARGATRIEEAPLRVEALAGEDVAEKMEMRPADATGFLSEMSGVRDRKSVV